MRYRTIHQTQNSRSGVVLLAVLVVLVMLTLAAYQFSELMIAETKASDSYTRAAQARALAESGIHYAAALLSSTDAFTNQLNSNPFDNPTMFQSILVRPNDAPRLQGRFSVIAMLGPDDAGASSQAFRFGVVDECGKINLNALMSLDSSGQVAHDIFMQLQAVLPDLTEDVVNSILDWIDPDDDPRSNGAESDYYSTLNPPYQAKNGPLDSLEELLLVKGITPQLLFGNDHNRNGILDNDEDDGSGAVNLGLSAFVTVYSREANFDSTGNPRIFVNDQDLNSLYEKLAAIMSDDMATFIIAYRMYGPASGTTVMSVAVTPDGRAGFATSTPAAAPAATPTTPAATRGTTAAPAAAGAGGGGGGGAARVTRSSLGNVQGGQARSIASLYELINTTVSIPSQTPNGQPTMLPSPLNDSGTMQQYLPIILDSLTTVKGAELPARVNVITAPQAVLAALPGIASTDVQAIIANRPTLSATDPPDPIYQTPAWLLTNASLSATTLRSLERYITSRSQVYRVQSVGYFDGGGPTSRIEAVIDTNNGRPRIIYYRDLTELGKGFDLQNSNP